MDIQVKVANKVASVIGSPVIICGNSDYNISFDFDTEWEGQNVKTARFVYKKDGGLKFNDVVFSGTVAPVPVLSGIDEVYLGIYAGELHTTTPARILCKRSILCPNPEPAPEPSADVYKQLLEVINNITDVLPSVTASDAGKLLKVNEAGAWVVGTDDAVTDIIEGKTSVARAVDADRAKVANLLAGQAVSTQIQYDRDDEVARVYGDYTGEDFNYGELTISFPEEHPDFVFYTSENLASFYAAFPDFVFLFSHEEFGEELITWHKDGKTGNMILKGQISSNSGGALHKYFIKTGLTALEVGFKRIYREAAVEKAINATYAETADSAATAAHATTADRATTANRATTAQTAEDADSVTKIFVDDAGITNIKTFTKVTTYYKSLVKKRLRIFYGTNTISRKIKEIVLMENNAQGYLWSDIGSDKNGFFSVSIYGGLSDEGKSLSLMAEKRSFSNGELQTAEVSVFIYAIYIVE